MLFKTSPALSDTLPPSPEQPSRRVLLTDDDLLRHVRSTEASVALHRALADPITSWASHKPTPVHRLGSSDSDAASFTLLSRESRTDSVDNEVLTIGDIACSPHELVSMLCSSSESDYNATMKGLYGNQYIYGSVMHVVKGEQSRPTVPEGHQLAVKTSCFVRSRVFAHNEQWCYLEYFRPMSGEAQTKGPADVSQGFSIALTSLSDTELVAGKVVGGRVDQLEDITAQCVVEPIDADTSKVRVTFYAFYTGNGSPAMGVASAKMAQSRLLSLAGGIHRLPAIVQRRRLGTQVFASSSTEARNSRCISCTKGMWLSTFAHCAHRCQLCAYNVCTSCWSRESVETHNGHVTQMGVCQRCIEWVGRCDYSGVQFDRRGRPEIVEDPVDRSAAGLSFREGLTNEKTKDATVAVINMLLGSADDPAPDNQFDNDDEGYMTAVQEYFHRRACDATSVEDCKVASAKERNYPLQPDDSASLAPIPDNEVERLKCISELRLMDLTEPIPELDIICDFLMKEMRFSCTVVSIIGKTHLLVLSSTDPYFMRAQPPRELTFCQYILMDTAPFIIRHPEADVRFYKLDLVRKQGLKYYCGIPITGPGGVILGSLCGANISAMDITRSQYDTLLRFGEIASKIIQVKAEAKLKVK